MNNSLRIWVDAARPKTLPLALVSILTGSVLAFSVGSWSWPVTGLALLTATLLQILSNLANDYGDALKGTDNEQRLGPMRAIQSGAVSLADMKQAMIINVLLTIVSGLALVFYALDSAQSIAAFLALGVLAILAAIAYTVGNKPYGYVGLGDVSVFIFFGLLGVSGSYFLHTGQIEWRLLLPSLGCGLLAVSVLNINNMRDIENDALCGKRTVVVRLGQQRAKIYHLLLLVGALCAFASYLLLQDRSAWLSVPFLFSLIVLFEHGQAVYRASQPVQMAPLLPNAVKCALVTNVLFISVVIAQTILR
ncbi:MAG: 1,4-dihydroxy-2-naphthoate polyprenyltransferase [Vibrio metschnikovii]|uniref:1,4-dihydroxy-2-naphthoate polyprenyltransferase n=1 Tax=Vibrio metschnikovii TaxID=28172 RepID=UPI0016465C8F|nr:1,4-dihydroxy-2-naphthoate polyprenyltransferase [Vibrio metschnikovii]MBC3621210.1 1,4-dihydroxy-2-naphthoate polyprenyltransferase [Vibrio metschnikovii]MBC5830984.1 1,4-dihydroxy-2-naphthoate polyprenyltransferase [Vibrio metschnikovii]MDA3139096.1 1,4-dihydroxy-2-naphthoate polyprenyltransferase [Vibrio metschnikovii]MDM7483728.1 1,4-dihydroxy-2-naphthoate polyprenyltransferase [Vibrio metschnikovii]